MNDEAVYRTAPSTPGLLITQYSQVFCITKTIDLMWQIIKGTMQCAKEGNC